MFKLWFIFGIQHRFNTMRVPRFDENDYLLIVLFKREIWVPINEFWFNQLYELLP